MQQVEPWTNGSDFRPKSSYRKCIGRRAVSSIYYMDGLELSEHAGTDGASRRHGQNTCNGALLHYRDASSDDADLMIFVSLNRDPCRNEWKSGECRQAQRSRKGDAALLRALCDSIGTFNLYFNIIEL